MTNRTFSVLLSVYEKEKPEFFRHSLESLLKQTRMPKEIVIVKDGRIGEELDSVIESFMAKQASLFKIVGYDDNRGLGPALNFGMQHITTPYVARMDTDDVAVPTRFEEQMSFLESRPDIDILGSAIAEFKDDPQHPLRARDVPDLHEMIRERARLTNPMNHMTVVFKKEKVVEAGGYQHAPYFEDYDLWVRMLVRGMKFHNLKRSLVLARFRGDTIGKRHGFQYGKYEAAHFRKMYGYGFIDRFGLIKALALRLPLRVLPKGLLLSIYKVLLRKKHGQSAHG
jgi:glycosyltransferase involved in cell wall biosynthesis